jgi:predicted kinase
VDITFRLEGGEDFPFKNTATHPTTKKGKMFLGPNPRVETLVDALAADLDRRKYVLILRGIPGSGKSSLGKQIQTLLWERFGLQAPICSADSFFETRRGYQFDRSQLSQAHEACAAAFARAITPGGTCRVVIVDNTNTQRWEYATYESEALARGFFLKILQVKCPDLLSATRVAKRNIHGVPPERVLMMFARWEDDGEEEEGREVVTFAPQFGFDSNTRDS